MIKGKQQETHSLLGREKESHGINLLWAIGDYRKLQLLKSNKGSFYNQPNWNEEYEYDKGLYYNHYGDDFDEESGESHRDFHSEKDSDSDCKSDRNNKNNITSEKNITVPTNTLESLIVSATRCKACHELVRLVEDRKKAFGLVCLLKIECSKQRCKLIKNQIDKNSTMLMAKESGSLYEINWAFVLACHLIGRVYSAALRLTSILNLDKPVTKTSRLNHMTTLCNVVEEVAEGSMKKVMIGAKEYIVKNGASGVPPEAVSRKKWTLVLALMTLGVWGVGPRNREL